MCARAQPEVCHFPGAVHLGFLFCFTEIGFHRPGVYQVDYACWAENTLETHLP